MEETAFFREGVPIHGETFEMVAYGMTPPQEALLLLLKRGIHLVFTWYSHAVFKFTVELLPVPLKVFTCRSWIACIMQHVCSPQCRQGSTSIWCRIFLNTDNTHSTETCVWAEGILVESLSQYDLITGLLPAGSWPPSLSSHARLSGSQI